MPCTVHDLAGFKHLRSYAMPTSISAMSQGSINSVLECCKLLQNPSIFGERHSCHMHVAIQHCQVKLRQMDEHKFVRKTCAAYLGVIQCARKCVPLETPRKKQKKASLETPTTLNGLVRATALRVDGACRVAVPHGDAALPKARPRRFVKPLHIILICRRRSRNLSTPHTNTDTTAV